MRITHLGAAKTLGLERHAHADDTTLHHHHGYARERCVPAVGTEELRVVVADATGDGASRVLREAVATAAGVHAELRDALVVVGEDAEVHLEEDVLHGEVTRTACHAER